MAGRHLLLTLFFATIYSQDCGEDAIYSVQLRSGTFYDASNPTVESTYSNSLTFRDRESLDSVFASSFAVELWVSMSDQEGDPIIATNVADWRRSQNRGWTIAASHDNRGVVVNVGTGNAPSSFEISLRNWTIETANYPPYTNVQDGAWHHVAVSFRTAADPPSLSVWVDGRFVTTTQLTANEGGRQYRIPPGHMANGQNLSVGDEDYYTGYRFPFSGSVDEVRVWAQDWDPAVINTRSVAVGEHPLGRGPSFKSAATFASSPSPSSSSSSTAPAPVTSLTARLGLDDRVLSPEWESIQRPGPLPEHLRYRVLGDAPPSTAVTCTATPTASPTIDTVCAPLAEQECLNDVRCRRSVREGSGAFFCVMDTQQCATLSTAVEGGDASLADARFSSACGSNPTCMVDRVGSTRTPAVTGVDLSGRAAGSLFCRPDVAGCLAHTTAASCVAAGQLCSWIPRGLLVADDAAAVRSVTQRDVAAGVESNGSSVGSGATSAGGVGEGVCVVDRATCGEINGPAECRRGDAGSAAAGACEWVGVGTGSIVEWGVGNAGRSHCRADVNGCRSIHPFGLLDPPSAQLCTQVVGCRFEVAGAEGAGARTDGATAAAAMSQGLAMQGTCVKDDTCPPLPSSLLTTPLSANPALDVCNVTQGCRTFAVARSAGAAAGTPVCVSDARQCGVFGQGGDSAVCVSAHLAGGVGAGGTGVGVFGTPVSGVASDLFQRGVGVSGLPSSNLAPFAPLGCRVASGVSEASTGVSSQTCVVDYFECARAVTAAECAARRGCRNLRVSALPTSAYPPPSAAVFPSGGEDSVCVADAANCFTLSAGANCTFTPSCRLEAGDVVSADTCAADPNRCLEHASRSACSASSECVWAEWAGVCRGVSQGICGRVPSTTCSAGGSAKGCKVGVVRSPETPPSTLSCVYDPVDCEVSSDVCGGRGCPMATGDCLCHRSATRGFWAGDDCSTCAVGYVGTLCDTPTALLRLFVGSSTTGERSLFYSDPQAAADALVGDVATALGIPSRDVSVTLHSLFADDVEPLNEYTGPTSVDRFERSGAVVVALGAQLRSSADPSLSPNATGDDLMAAYADYVAASGVSAGQQSSFCGAPLRGLAIEKGTATADNAVVEANADVTVAGAPPVVGTVWCGGGAAFAAEDGGSDSSLWWLLLLLLVPLCCSLLLLLLWLCVKRRNKVGEEKEDPPMVAVEDDGQRGSRALQSARAVVDDGDGAATRTVHSARPLIGGDEYLEPDPIPYFHEVDEAKEALLEAADERDAIIEDEAAEAAGLFAYAASEKATVSGWLEKLRQQQEAAGKAEAAAREQQRAADEAAREQHALAYRLQQENLQRVKAIYDAQKSAVEGAEKEARRALATTWAEGLISIADASDRDAMAVTERAVLACRLHEQELSSSRLSQQAAASTARAKAAEREVERLLTARSRELSAAAANASEMNMRADKLSTEAEALARALKQQTAARVRAEKAAEAAAAQLSASHAKAAKDRDALAVSAARAAREAVVFKRESERLAAEAASAADAARCARRDATAADAARSDAERALAHAKSEAMSAFAQSRSAAAQAAAAENAAATSTRAAQRRAEEEAHNAAQARQLADAAVAQAEREREAARRAVDALAREEARLRQQMENASARANASDANAVAEAKARAAAEAQLGVLRSRLTAANEAQAAATAARDAAVTAAALDAQRADAANARAAREAAAAAAASRAKPATMNPPPTPPPTMGTPASPLRPVTAAAPAPSVGLSRSGRDGPGGRRGPSPARRRRSNGPPSSPPPVSAYVDEMGAEVPPEDVHGQLGGLDGDDYVAPTVPRPRASSEELRISGRVPGWVNNYISREGEKMAAMGYGGR